MYYNFEHSLETESEIFWNYRFLLCFLIADILRQNPSYSTWTKSDGYMFDYHQLLWDDTSPLCFSLADIYLPKSHIHNIRVENDRFVENQIFLQLSGKLLIFSLKNFRIHKQLIFHQLTSPHSTHYRHTKHMLPHNHNGLTELFKYFNNF
jgi:hypothetical protein